uniref:Uncharacterized protein n=1 Tax=Odontella aurita TaxID=265563 RepID=A0A7S4IUX7_9STRA|mmetsp:Transcript_30526/g.91169  ORF Transcript_30526/g.91169 Transcript_30526/m.91169 type:complete len:170 (+) Transcript_30526:1797-2306(+)
MIAKRLGLELAGLVGSASSGLLAGSALMETPDRSSSGIYIPCGATNNNFLTTPSKMRHSGSESSSPPSMPPPPSGGEPQSREGHTSCCCGGRRCGGTSGVACGRRRMQQWWEWWKKARRPRSPATSTGDETFPHDVDRTFSPETLASAAGHGVADFNMQCMCIGDQHVT